MELRDYLYHYSNIYFKNEVMYTICSENYKNADADNNYIRFVTKYQRLYELIYDNSDDIIRQALEIAAKSTAEGYNDFMLKCLKDTLIKNNKEISEADWGTIKNYLKEFMLDESVNQELINVVRRIEENYFK